MDNCSLLIRTWERETSTPGLPNRVGSVIAVEPFNAPWGYVDRGRNEGSDTGLAVIKVTGLAVGTARRRLIVPVFKGFEFVDPTPPVLGDPDYGTWRPPKNRSLHRRWHLDLPTVRAGLKPVMKARFIDAIRIDGIEQPLDELTVVPWALLKSALKNAAGNGPVSDWMAP